jgi:hypothetical protein
MEISTATSPLAQLAMRASCDPHFLGYALSAVQRRIGIGDQLLAALLALDPERLPHLRLCRMPRAETWQADIAAIAVYAGCDATRLADVLWQATGIGDPGPGHADTEEGGAP